MKKYDLLKITTFIFFIISDFFIPVGMGQTGADTSQYRDLDPIIVTGVRFEQEKSKVPGAISVISREEIESNSNVSILPALSAQVPGLFLNNRSIVGFGVGPNSGGNISIRGISGTPNSRVLVLIDGQPQFMGIFAHPIADAYSASDIERAEVIRGASSLLYGSNAMGGAINLITRKATKEGWQGAAKIGYGSYQTKVLSGTLAYKKEKLNTFLSLNHYRTEGYRKSARDDFRNTTAFFKIGYALHKKWDISADLQLADATYYHPGTVAMPLETDKRDFLRGRGAISLKNSFQKVNGGIFLFYNWGDHSFAEGFQSNDTNKGLAIFQNIKIFPGNTLTIGLDYKSYGGTAFNEKIPPPVRVGFGERHEVDETDLYVSVHQQLLKKLSLNGGVRWASNSIYGDNLLPSAGINFQVANHTHLKALFSTAFRSPSVADLFLFPTSNRKLKPEEVSNYELGIIRYFWDKRMEVELTGFMNEGENLIQVIPVASIPEARNSGSFSNRGLEAQMKYYAHDHFYTLLNYSRIDVSENVLYSPRQMINLQLSYTNHKLAISADIQQINGLRNSVLPEQPLENYNLINLRGSYQWIESLQFFAEGNNFLDTTYEVEDGYPMPGVNILGGLKFKF